MIDKLKEMLTPNGYENRYNLANPVTITAEEAAKIFAVLLSVSNLLDAPMANGKPISSVDLCDFVTMGVERITICTEDLANVQKAWRGLE